MKRRMNGYLLAGLIVTGLMAALILVGLVWTPYDPDALLAGPKLEGPSLAHWLGTDSFGRDIFSRVLQGAGTTFLIALSTVAIGAVCGTAAGALTGYFGGVVDEVLMRLNDALTAFPSILLALVLISILGPGNKYNVVIALGIVFIPSFARVTRTAFAALRDVNYVKSARLMGASSLRGQPVEAESHQGLHRSVHPPLSRVGGVCPPAGQAAGRLYPAVQARLFPAGGPAVCEHLLPCPAGAGGCPLGGAVLSCLHRSHAGGGAPGGPLSQLRL